jgi:hypothetical protein
MVMRFDNSTKPKRSPRTGTRQKLSRDDLVTALLLRELAGLISLRTELQESDFERYPSLSLLYRAADDLAGEIGYRDE